jgi:hypothetical protein
MQAMDPLAKFSHYRQSINSVLLETFLAIKSEIVVVLYRLTENTKVNKNSMLINMTDPHQLFKDLTR